MQGSHVLSLSNFSCKYFLGIKILRISISFPQKKFVKGNFQEWMEGNTWRNHQTGKLKLSEIDGMMNCVIKFYNVNNFFQISIEIVGKLIEDKI